MVFKNTFCCFTYLVVSDGTLLLVNVIIAQINSRFNTQNNSQPRHLRTEVYAVQRVLKNLETLKTKLLMGPGSGFTRLISLLS